ncbi:GNAT family N-acetyltransferase [Acidithiobacillus sp. M4-SHS-6]|uniref:GNAT family N-acetyltransferase n=1 Tax=Acidithiobacillus sp. M4-SHS-6 TaxID=3383024 RepID=UPI0039BDBFD5
MYLFKSKVCQNLWKWMIETDTVSISWQFMMVWLVGTARLDPGLNGKVGRLAVLYPYRRKGVGRRLMSFLHQSAWDMGLSEVWCHAQLSAQGFYTQLGYTKEGAVFQEAGIDHITMRCVRN